MRLYIQEHETEEVLFITTDFNCVPNNGERVMLERDSEPAWYVVTEVTYYFRHHKYTPSDMDDNSVTVWVKEMPGKI